MDFSNDENLNRMQREAIERAREMHKRAQGFLEQKRHEPEPEKSKELFDLGGIKIDEEKALIAMMIYIIYKNGGDIKLLLALLYLLI
ncbi:MAG: hypothetical protein IJ740_12465 [Ruminococcus sp.]|nr:hypothetical protein [Ruminococcus sp.]